MVYKLIPTQHLELVADSKILCIFVKKTMAVLYRHIRLDKNEPFYVGIGKFEKRAYSKTKRNNFWNKIVAKTEYDVEIILSGLSWEQAQEKEKEFIKLYGRKDLGLGTLVNLTDGGDLPANLSEHSRRIIREKRAKQTFTEESNIRRSLSQKGKAKPKTKPVSEETKRKLSNKMKGRVFTEEHRKKLSEAAMGNKNGIQNLKQYQSK